MGKKCIPGLICIENMTLFLLIVLIVFVAYFYYNSTKAPNPVIIIQQPLGNSGATIPVLNGQEASLSPPTNGMYMAPNQLPTTRVGPRGSGQTQGTETRFAWYPPMSDFELPCQDSRKARIEQVNSWRGQGH